eukprot:TRINITY_DN12306_c0_g1_i1.p1 TRINITY_DN12306_c0_g1~~TRINITY_DN12306_c0_g1_i1.p1  ORF type:complete len:659 (+),score=102.36 TRINITY_DN12306_c0_g1_i1:350-2326(+)
MIPRKGSTYRVQVNQPGGSLPEGLEGILDEIFIGLGIPIQSRILCKEYIETNMERQPTGSEILLAMSNTKDICEDFLYKKEEDCAAVILQSVIKRWMVRSKYRELVDAEHSSRKGLLFSDLLNSQKSIIKNFKLILDFRDLLVQNRSKLGIGSDDIDTIFFSIDGIYNFHRRFLQRLYRGLYNWPHVHIGAIFDQFEYQLYGEFTLHYKYSLRSLSLLIKNRPRLGPFLKSIAVKTDLGLSLEDLLAVPLTDISKYRYYLEMFTRDSITTQQEYAYISQQFCKMYYASVLSGEFSIRSLYYCQIKQVEKKLGNSFCLTDNPDRKLICSANVRIFNKPQGKKHKSGKFYLFNDIYILVKKTGKVKTPISVRRSNYEIVTNPNYGDIIVILNPDNLSRVNFQFERDQKEFLNLIKENKISNKQKNRLFGRSIEYILMNEKCEDGVPNFLRISTQHILHSEINITDLFNSIKGATRITKLVEEFEKSEDYEQIYLNEYHPSDVLSVLVYFLKELETPFFVASDLGKVTTEKLINRLSFEMRTVLQFLVQFLVDLSFKYTDDVAMAQFIIFLVATVFSPLIIVSEKPTTSDDMTNLVREFPVRVDFLCSLINNYKVTFDKGENALKRREIFRHKRTPTQNKSGITFMFLHRAFKPPIVKLDD